MRLTLAAAALAAAILCGSASGQAPSGQAAIDTSQAPKVIYLPPGMPAPAEVYAGDSEVEGVFLSPSGRYVATIGRHEQVTYIIMEDLAGGGKPASLNLGDTRIHEFLWVSDDRVVYSLGARRFDVDFTMRGAVIKGAPQYWTMHRDFSNPIKLLGSAVEAHWRSSGGFSVSLDTFGATRVLDDPGHVMIPDEDAGGRLDLFKVDLATGKGVVAGEGSENTLNWIIGRDGAPVMRFDSNKRGTEVRVMTQQKKTWTEVMRFRRDQLSGKTEEFYPVAPGPSPETYYVIGRPAGQDRMGVHLYNVAMRAYVSEVFTHPEVDVSSAIFDERTGAFSGAAFWASRFDVKFADAKLQKHYDALKGYFGPAINVAITGKSDDQAVWLIYASGPGDPGSYHIYDTRKASSKELRQVNTTLFKLPLAKVQAVSWKASDGLAINGYLTLPPNVAKDAKPPLIVYPHGGPEARDYGGFNPVTQFLATRGYAVFQPNFRGSSGYGRAFTEASRRQFGRKMQSDVNEGVDYLASQGLVDASRACILGESYGGYAALVGITQDAARYKCAVSFAGLSDLFYQMRWERDQEGYDSLGYKYWVEQIGDPNKDGKEMEAWSPIRKIDQITSPVLLIHGKKDTIVPIEQSEMMEKAMKKAGKDVEYIVFENNGHDFNDGALLIYLNKLQEFFGKHLPVAQAAAPAAN